MNFAHFHLIVNHIPVIGIPIAALVLAYSLYTKNRPMQQFSLVLLSAIALMVLPAYLSGESAEEVIEHLSGVAESLIEEHEEAAEASLILTLLTGASAILGVWFRKQESKLKTASLATLGFAVLSLGSLMCTANRGGMIRHPEIRDENGATSSMEIHLDHSDSPEEDEHEGHDHDHE